MTMVNCHSLQVLLSAGKRNLIFSCFQMAHSQIPICIHIWTASIIVPKPTFPLLFHSFFLINNCFEKLSFNESLLWRIYKNGSVSAWLEIVCGNQYYPWGWNKSIMWEKVGWGHTIEVILRSFTQLAESYNQFQRCVILPHLVFLFVSKPKALSSSDCQIVLSSFTLPTTKYLVSIQNISISGIKT